MNRATVTVLGALLMSSGVGCKGARSKDNHVESTEPAPGVIASPAPVPSAPAPFASPPMLAGTPDVAGLVAKVNPTVVNITTVHEVQRPNVEFDFPFDFFGQMVPPEARRPRGGDVQKERALGSGFIIDGEGHVVTNAHVVEQADEVKVKLADERELDAKVVGRDTRLDLAVLRMEGGKDAQPAKLGSSDALRVGEYVVAIGNPFGLGHTVTMGIVSAKSRAIGAGPYDDFIQTDASINPGNSGGPLFNLKGEVIGINTAINPRAQGIGFAIPADALKDVLPQLLATGHVARGRIGALVQPVDSTMAKAMGLDRPKGALVAEVEAGGAAAQVGVKPGDVIVRVDQTDVLHSSDLPRIVARHAPGSHVKLVVLRDGKETTFDVTLQELKDETAERTSDHLPSKPSLGIELGDGREGAVVRDIRSGSPADGQLEQGDVIVEVNHTPVSSAADVAKQVEKTPAGTSVLFKVKRGDRTRFVAIERRQG
jgi:serine protease Do